MHICPDQRRVELLAPAGSMECLHAAVRAGADAVYLGLDQFNARRNADNFTVESLAQACAYAHLRGVRVYVTLNVAVLPAEVDAALKLARDAHRAGADAFIVQDIGLASLLSRELPQARLHVSTQMNTHNAAGIEFAWQLGARRVTLARELSLPEVEYLAQVAADFGMEVETFAHGALCVCYSGQCLMSSMIGGRSANRGLCAQACRLPYDLHSSRGPEALASEGEHLLSPKDLCTIDMVDQLVAAGVSSLKIEGRMKSADYVHEVVSVYRQVIDSGEPATEAHRARLAEAFSRGFTIAYLEGRRGNEIMSYGRPNNRGVFVGRVVRVGDGFAQVEPEVALNDGDVLEFWTNRGHFAATLADACPAKDGTVRVPVEQRVGKGDRVFRVRNAATAFADDELEPRIPVTGSVELTVGEPVRIAFRATAKQGETCEVVLEGPVVEPARTRPVTEGDVRAHVDRLGQTPFRLVSLDVTLSPEAGIGFSTLHHLRADALQQLERSLIAANTAPSAAPFPQHEAGGAQLAGGQVAVAAQASVGDRCADESAPQVVSTVHAPLEAETPGGAHQASSARRESASGAFAKAGLSERLSTSRGLGLERSSKEPQVVAWVTNPTTARAARKAGADMLYVPALNYRRGQSALQGVRQEVPDQAGYPSKCVMSLPPIDHDPVGFAREAAFEFDIWDYVKEGRPVYADSMASAVRALSVGAQVEVGTHVPITNAATLQLLAAMGVARAWLSPELTLGQIDDIARNAPLPLGIVVSGRQELMVTEHCLLMSQGPCNEQCEACPRRAVAHHLTDRKDFDFPVVTDMLGRSHLYNGVELDTVASMVDLVDIGVGAFMVDATFLDKKGTAEAVGRVVRARDLAVSEHRAMAKRPNTTTGHLFRGVS